MKIRVARAEDGGDVADIYAPIVADTFISFEDTPPSASEMAQRIEAALPINGPAMSVSMWPRMRDAGASPASFMPGFSKHSSIRALAPYLRELPCRTMRAWEFMSAWGSSLSASIRALDSSRARGAMSDGGAAPCRRLAIHP